MRIRKRFAAPFVVTFAAACNSSETPPKTPEVDVTASAAPSTTPTVAPSAAPTTKPAESEESWTIRQEGKNCFAEVEDNCPEGASCNPPPPVKYPCPTNIQNYPATVSREAGAKTCVTRVFSSMACDPGEHCNPPPPHNEPVPCPK